MREIESQPELLDELNGALRTWDDVVAYPPNQVFIGNLTPDELAAIPRPWSDHPVAPANPEGRFGRLVTQAALYGLMKLSDDFELLTITDALAERARAELSGFDHRLERIVGVGAEELSTVMAEHEGLPLYYDGELAGFIRTVHERDATLEAHVLLENLACKATAAMAVSDLLLSLIHI